MRKFERNCCLKGHIYLVRKRQLKFPWHIIKKNGLENLTLTGLIKSREAKGNSDLHNFRKRMTEKRVDGL